MYLGNIAREGDFEVSNSSAHTVAYEYETVSSLRMSVGMY